MSIADSIVSQADYYGPEIHHPALRRHAPALGAIDNTQIALEQVYALLHGEEAVPRDEVIHNLRLALTERKGEAWMEDFHAAVTPAQD